MQQGKRKITALVFLLIVTMPILLSVRFVLEQGQVQEEMEEKLGSVNLETLNVPVSEINWVRAGKEVLFEGKLFDVRSFTVQNDMVTLTGFFDMEETELQEEYKNIVENNEGDPPFSDLVIKLLLSSLYTDTTTITYEAGWNLIDQQYYGYDEMATAASVLPPTPPPQS